MELCQYGADVCEVPAEIMDCTSLKDVLSAEVWQNVLSDKDRLHLLQYLPELDKVELEKTLVEVFEGDNFHFSRPLREFERKLISGDLNPLVSCYSEGLLMLQRRQHSHYVRQYHNDMVSALLEMKQLWQLHPGAELQEKLNNWKKCKNPRLILASQSLREPVQKSTSATAAENRDHSIPLDGGNLSSGTDKDVKLVQEIAPVNSVLKKRKRERIEDANSAHLQKNRATPLVVDTKPLVAEVKAGGAKVDTKEAVKTPKGRKAAVSIADESLGYSILHLLSAVRTAMLHSWDSNDRPQFFGVDEIVSRVRSNPGDARIIQENVILKDLVCAALRVIGSKAPPGTRMWKPFVQAKQQGKEWGWVGIPPVSAEDLSVVHVEAEVWGVADKALMKLQERFLDMQASASPSPKISVPKVKGPSNNLVTPRTSGAKKSAVEKKNSPLKVAPERMSQGDFGIVNGMEVAVKSEDEEGKSTINDVTKNEVSRPASPSDAKSFFQQEERSRYLQPSKAFHYTAMDGGKSIVAPIRRPTMKSTAKARDHAMLKPDRPAHVTILCLVRDAAARMCNGVGTRADVCSLLRDSQYLVGDTPDNQVNQIVSGAMDRLHYERDPCVKYEAEKKLWQYLHRDRLPSDFDQDGTKSTRNDHKRKASLAAEDATADMDGDEYGLDQGLPGSQEERVSGESRYREQGSGSPVEPRQIYSGDDPEISNYQNGSHALASAGSSDGEELRHDGIEEQPGKHLSPGHSVLGETSPPALGLWQAPAHEFTPVM